LDSTNILHMFVAAKQTDMKNWIFGLFLVAFFATFNACRFGRRHSTIVETSNNNYLKIEYAGKVYFNEAGTEISHISPGGYVKYEKNEKKLEAEDNGRGGVKYELYDNGEKLGMDENGKKFIAEAVHMMMRKGFTPPNKN